MRLAIGAAAVLAIAGAAQAATTRKVPQDYATIQAAEDAAQDGDTILVSKGRYILDATVNIDVPNLVVKGAGAIVDGARPNMTNFTVDCFNVSAQGVTITGFTFRNGETGVYVNAANCAVLKCVFIDQDDDALYVDLGDGLRVEGCKFLGNYTAVEAYAANLRALKNTIRVTDDYGIYVEGSGARLEGNTLSYIEDSDAIHVYGANPVILKNKLFNIDSDSIYCENANGGNISGNTVKFTDSTGIYVDSGDNVIAEKNRITDVSDGIYVSGSAATVRSNKVVGFHGGDGIGVSSDGMVIVGNTVSFGTNDAEGFDLDSASATGGGTVEGNKCNDVMGRGFTLGSAFSNVQVANCTATNCGSENETGFYINGNDCTLTGLKATNVDNIGILVSTGTSNDFVKCSVANINADGFRISTSSDGNTFTDCTAANCGGEGFDNRGTNTQVTGGKYRGDRSDVANDTPNGATITLTNVDKLTPGTPQSQVD